MQRREQGNSRNRGREQRTSWKSPVQHRDRCFIRQRMRGILKRKLDEDPSSFMSDYDEISGKDSGNSSDSLTHHIPSGPLDPSILQPHPPKRLRGRNVHFESVTVYYFSRRQGFTSVPTQGGSTLGMSPRHSSVRRFSLRQFAMEKNKSHRNMLRAHLREEKLNAIKLKLKKHSAMSLVEADALTFDDISEDDLDMDNTEEDDYFFLQPLTTRRRRALLRASGVRRIDVEEKHELRALRMSREECGCHCMGACDQETCACSLAGIKCQVDRMSFPCGCTKEGCTNTSGRLEFNPVRVRTHFLHTIMKLELEKSRKEQQWQSPQHEQDVTNGNSYHGDSALVRHHSNQHFPLISTTAPHSPIMCLQSMGDADLQLDEDEDEEDDEVEEEDENDETYKEGKEDNSSVSSALSDCSTHSLETLDPEESEDDEEVEDEEDDDEEEEEWASSECDQTPSLYCVPYPSILTYFNNPQMSLNDAYHSSTGVQHFSMNNSANPAAAFFNGPAAPLPRPPESTQVSKLTSEPFDTQSHCQMMEDRNSSPHLPDNSVLLTAHPCPLTANNCAPSGPSDELQPKMEFKKLDQL